MRCMKNEPRESSSTSESGLAKSASAFGSEDAVVLFLAGFLTTLVFWRSGFAGLSCGFAGLSCGFFFQNGSSPRQRCTKFWENIWKKQVKEQKGYMILTVGGLLETQKGLNPVWLQTASGSFSIFFTASVTSASVSWMSTCRWGSFKLPVYSHIKPGRRLKGNMLQVIQQRAKSTRVKPFAIKALSFDSCGA